MSHSLHFYTVNNFQTFSGAAYSEIQLSYQLFGCALGSAPVVVVNHALTGNSDVASEETGWWKQLVGDEKTIDTKKYTVLAFNVPGNAYDGNIIEHIEDFTAKDIAQLFVYVLKALNIKHLYAVIGGSVGGGIAWEMAVLEPNYIRYLIPVAADWKSTDWVIGHAFVQQNILNNSTHALRDARMMAMLFYRTSASLDFKFSRSKTPNGKQFNVESWLQHHGKKLEARFELQAYKMMNHLLATIDVASGKDSFADAVKSLRSVVVQIAIDTDLFFVKEENLRTQQMLDALQIPNQYHEIVSLHGHDAFLIEYEQLQHILTPIFK